MNVKHLFRSCLAAGMLITALSSSPQRSYARPYLATAFRLIPYPCSLIPVLPLPPDVRPGHWAAPFVQEALTNGVMTLTDGREFHGEARVTHAEAIGALARLARILEAGKWQTQPTRPVPETAVKPLLHGDWRGQRVTRYEMAKALANMGDYVANGLPRPDPHAKNLGKSEILPPRPPVKIAKSNSAYVDLVYLVNARMVTPNSPLLTADDKPILGAEMSRVLADVVIGLTDRATDLGQEADGSSPDASFHKKPADKSGVKP